MLEERELSAEVQQWARAKGLRLTAALSLSPARQASFGVHNYRAPHTYSGITLLEMQQLCACGHLYSRSSRQKEWELVFQEAVVFRISKGSPGWCSGWDTHFIMFIGGCISAPSCRPDCLVAAGGHLLWIIVVAKRVADLRCAATAMMCKPALEVASKQTLLPSKPHGATHGDPCTEFAADHGPQCPCQVQLHPQQAEAEPLNWAPGLCKEWCVKIAQLRVRHQ